MSDSHGSFEHITTAFICLCVAAACIYFAVDLHKVWLLAVSATVGAMSVLFAALHAADIVREALRDAPALAALEDQH